MGRFGYRITLATGSVIDQVMFENGPVTATSGRITCGGSVVIGLPEPPSNGVCVAHDVDPLSDANNWPSNLKTSWVSGDKFQPKTLTNAEYLQDSARLHTDPPNVAVDPLPCLSAADRARIDNAVAALLMDCETLDWIFTRLNGEFADRTGKSIFARPASVS